jgi:vacuolar-type H+-ATPase subunit I/STV1
VKTKTREAPPATARPRYTFSARNAALMFSSVLYAIHAWVAYTSTPPPSSTVTTRIYSVVPAEVWSGLWSVAGALGLLAVAIGLVAGLSRRWSPMPALRAATGAFVIHLIVAWLWAGAMIHVGLDLGNVRAAAVGLMYLALGGFELIFAGLDDERVSRRRIEGLELEVELLRRKVVDLGGTL